MDRLVMGTSAISERSDSLSQSSWTPSRSNRGATNLLGRSIHVNATSHGRPQQCRHPVLQQQHQQQPAAMMTAFSVPAVASCQRSQPPRRSPQRSSPWLEETGGAILTPPTHLGQGQLYILDMPFGGLEDPVADDDDARTVTNLVLADRHHLNPVAAMSSETVVPADVISSSLSVSSGSSSSKLGWRGDTRARAEHYHSDEVHTLDHHKSEQKRRRRKKKAPQMGHAVSLPSDGYQPRNNGVQSRVDPGELSSGRYPHHNHHHHHHHVHRVQQQSHHVEGVREELLMKTIWDLQTRLAVAEKTIHELRSNPKLLPTRAAGMSDGDGDDDDEWDGSSASRRKEGFGDSSGSRGRMGQRLERKRSPTTVERGLPRLVGSAPPPASAVTDRRHSGPMADPRQEYSSPSSATSTPRTISRAPPPISTGGPTRMAPRRDIPPHRQAPYVGEETVAVSDARGLSSSPRRWEERVGSGDGIVGSRGMATGRNVSELKAVGPVLRRRGTSFTRATEVTEADDADLKALTNGVRRVKNQSLSASSSSSTSSSAAAVAVAAQTARVVEYSAHRDAQGTLISGTMSGDASSRSPLHYMPSMPEGIFNNEKGASRIRYHMASKAVCRHDDDNTTTITNTSATASLRSSIGALKQLVDGDNDDGRSDLEWSYRQQVSAGTGGTAVQKPLVQHIDTTIGRRMVQEQFADVANDPGSPHRLSTTLGPSKSRFPSRGTTNRSDSCRLGNASSLGKTVSGRDECGCSGNGVTSNTQTLSAVHECGGRITSVTGDDFGWGLPSPAPQEESLGNSAPLKSWALYQSRMEHASSVASGNISVPAPARESGLDTIPSDEEGSVTSWGQSHHHQPRRGRPPAQQQPPSLAPPPPPPPPLTGPAPCDSDVSERCEMIEDTDCEEVEKRLHHSFLWRSKSNGDVSSAAAVFAINDGIASEDTDPSFDGDDSCHNGIPAPLPQAPTPPSKGWRSNTTGMLRRMASRDKEVSVGESQQAQQAQQQQQEAPSGAAASAASAFLSQEQPPPQPSRRLPFRKVFKSIISIPSR